jgi:hypothetical protein
MGKLDTSSRVTEGISTRIRQKREKAAPAVSTTYTIGAILSKDALEE